MLEMVIFVHSVAAGKAIRHSCC